MAACCCCVEAETRHVLVLGLSQHGKTTFLNGLGELQQGFVETEGAQTVGDGIQSCTTHPAEFNLHRRGKPTHVLHCSSLPNSTKRMNLASLTEDVDTVRRTRWNNLKKDRDFKCDVELGQQLCTGHNMVGGINRGNLFYGSKRAAVGAGLDDEEGEEHGESVPLCVHAIDTPGVEDCQGLDDQNIERVIDAVLDAETLYGLVMVTKCGHPITPTWQAQVERYWKLFPMMRAQWIFVHTNADPLAVNNPQRRKKSSFEEMAAQRMKLVTTAMRNLTDDPSFDAAHIFIESDVEDYECLKAFLVEQHNAFFTLIANFSPVRIGQLTYEKGPRSLATDQTVMSALDATISATTTTVAELDKELGALWGMRNLHVKQRMEMEKRLYLVLDMLKSKDHDGPVDKVKTVYQPWAWLAFPKEEVQIDTRHAEYKVSIIDTAGYRCSYLRETRERQLEVLERGCHRLTITTGHTWLFTNMSGKVVISSPSRLVYEMEIQELKRQKVELQADLKELNARHKEAESYIYVTSELAGESEARLKTAQQAKAFLTMPWTIGTWRAMRPFYEAPAHESTAQLVSEFQRCWYKVVQEEIPLWSFGPVDIVSS